MKCVDLFAGCGGLSLGFLKAGFSIIHAFDNWLPAIEVYRQNFLHSVTELDLANKEEAIKKIKSLDPDLIMGGPPCQDFSSARKQDGSTGKAVYTEHFAEIVCRIKPSWFVMENVDRIRNTSILSRIVKKFCQENYGLSAVLLNAAYCGVPQSRTRFFLIGHLHDGHNKLNRIFKKNLSEKPMTVREYLGDSLETEWYYRHPRSYQRRGIFSIDEPSPTVRGVNRPIPKTYQLSPCDPKGIDISEVRPLTTIERSYIQTFPINFTFSGSKTNLETMIGNAVPVNLAEFVARTIQEYINFEEPLLLEIKSEFKIPQKVLHRIPMQKISV